MPRRAKRRSDRPSEPARDPDQRPQHPTQRPRRAGVGKMGWFNRRRSSLRTYGIVGVVVVGVIALVAFGVRESFGSDFQFSMYQGADLLGVSREDAKFSEVFPRDTPLILNFWAGQCPPCRAEMPAFQRLSQEFAGEVVLFGLDVGPFTGLGSNRDAQDLLRQLGVTYPAGYALDRGPVAQHGVTTMPTTLFLTADGKTFRKRTGLLQESEMRRLVEDLIQASS